ncbi:AAA family ATPase [Kamptonema animale CS-326]|jgi:exonuclease SbcC|uniref:AAA family ATPase n=1 Tax=Kamptonema animale TaxID=92934 RepID=UPI00232BF393|nr:AAA family ATPase [Kamptonema animale]MDB9511342.1 AAA family ATPase [Kamptonema animale CS-326]
MIPQQLTLKNFLSYRDATLDFRGLHTACICGPNGAGKTSLLEAIAWAIWGNCRTASEDDIIHIGETEVRVDFVFATHGEIYRIIRNRRRGQSGTLEFQIATDSAVVNGEIKAGSFRTLTEKGLRVTQQKIIEHLKLDYETFINSAYLRQGRADEFMLKKPSDRKEILAGLLKLDQYDILAEQAKEKSREFKAQVEFLQKSLYSLKGQLLQRDEISTKQTNLQQITAQLQQQQNSNTEKLQQLQGQQHQRQTGEKLLIGQQQQHSNIAQECNRLQQELATVKQQQQEIQALLQQESEITTGLTLFQKLQIEEETLSAKFKAHQEAQNQRQQLQEQQRQIVSQISGKVQQVQAQLETLEQQQKEVQDILNQQPEAEAGLAQLQAARTRLSQLDRLQLQVAPLLQRRQQLQTQLDRAHARLSARLEELNSRARSQQATYQQKQPELHRELQAVATHILQLENKRVYQQRVTEKGQERHHFLKSLEDSQRDFEARLAELDQKIQLLGIPPNHTDLEEQKLLAESDIYQNLKLKTQDLQLPNCPLCDRPLDEHHWSLVVTKHRHQQQELWNQLWVIREQLTISNRELEVLRNEYRQLGEELAPYETLRERRGNLQAQIDALGIEQLRVQELLAEASAIEKSLRSGEYAAEDYAELQQLEQNLQVLNYSEQNHALVRNQEKSLRWAEIKMSRIKEAQQKLQKINSRRPELHSQLTSFQQQIQQQQTDSEIQQQIQSIDRYLAEIGYSLEQHSNIRAELRKNQFWLSRAEKLRQAQKQYPQIQQRVSELGNLIQVRSQDLETLNNQILAIRQQLQQTPDTATQIAEIEQQIQHRRQQLDQNLASLGRIEQQQQHLENLQTQCETQQQQLETARKQYRVYQELSQAFGKNGIQAFMIENVLPQLEAETNHILSRLSANQLHVQFITQRAAASKKATKLIETLDILIADARGTRPYETYSGGEAFRINFAIRLALAKLLAQRAGTALQMLIIDEGFGTQDSEGCDRLIAAINAIAPDFECILAVTHVPHLREAFQARIEVSKTPQGSRINLSI